MHLYALDRGPAGAAGAVVGGYAAFEHSPGEIADETRSELGEKRELERGIVQFPNIELPRGVYPVDGRLYR
jgi:hypothetical protein